MNKRKIAPGIFVVRFRSQYGVASTFLRFQEHYESSRFRNRVFSLEEFMDWYADRFGAFTYYEDWAGFNVPSTAFADFYAGKFDPLLLKEQRLLSLFRSEPQPFYVIGISKNVDLKHELAHALFFTLPAYRAAVLAAMRRYDTSAIRKRLAAIGYHRAVLADEVHAYLLSPSGTIKGTARRLAALRAELRSIYRRHAAGLRVD
jgi:hypothetical protein